MISRSQDPTGGGEKESDIFQEETRFFSISHFLLFDLGRLSLIECGHW
jgi:hypothetical protein